MYIIIFFNHILKKKLRQHAVAQQDLGVAGEGDWALVLEQFYLGKRIEFTNKNYI